MFLRIGKLQIERPATTKMQESNEAVTSGTAIVGREVLAGIFLSITPKVNSKASSR
jgi:hypothetical protein